MAITDDSVTGKQVMEAYAKRIIAFRDAETAFTRDPNQDTMDIMHRAIDALDKAYQAMRKLETVEGLSHAVDGLRGKLVADLHAEVAEAVLGEETQTE